MRAADPAASFGAGSDEPFASALAEPGRTLSLHEVRDDGEIAPGRRLDLDRFLGAADAADDVAIDGVCGPVLDIGCGPGRMVDAAAARGHLAMGIDVSPIAVRLARSRGLSVLRRSVFGDVPGDGRWCTLMLMDGNIGIGGDPTALLHRCADLLRPDGGRLVVETHEDPLRDDRFEGVVIDDLGRRSLPFPWAEVGSVALRGHAAAAGFAAAREWVSAGRSFAEYRRP